MKGVIAVRGKRERAILQAVYELYDLVCAVTTLCVHTLFYAMVVPLPDCAVGFLFIISVFQTYTTEWADDDVRKNRLVFIGRLLESMLTATTMPTC